MIVTSTQRSRQIVQILPVLLLGAVALLARVVGLADYLTTDEVYHWIGRVERFNDAVAHRQWAGTIQTGHPGVTTMMLGGIGLVLERTFVGLGWAHVTSQVEHLAWLRLPSAVLQALLVPVAYLLLRRLVGTRIALIAAALWATSPYLIAHGRLLHVDALLTTFITFSIIHLLLACRAERPWRHLVIAGCYAGLALLTKGPALILLPIAGLLLFMQVSATTLVERMRRAVGWYGVWLGVAAFIVALWPAWWVAPGHVFYKYTDEIISNGGRPNGSGQFFLGRAVGDPGPWFYPIADLFRLTPLATFGLLLLPFALWRRRRERGVLLALGMMVLLWTLVMTVGQKKFDRYTLPTWPALMILSAAGLGQLWHWSGSDAGRRRMLAARAWSIIVVGVLVVGLVQPVLSAHPYYLSYYNPLMGGGAAAERALLIGWGEGMDQVGAYLRSRPDIGYGPIISALPRSLQPFVPVPVKDVTELGRSPANYAVVYLESIQRAAHPDIYGAIQETIPLHAVTIEGITYARIYQLPKPFAQPVEGQWGDALHLRGITLERQPGQLIVTPSWDVRAVPAAAYMVFIHLLDAQGNAVARLDVPPGGGDFPPTNGWQPGQQIAVPLPMPIPPTLAPGDYELVMGVYDSETGTRLPLLRGTPADAARAGPDALRLSMEHYP